MFHAEITLQGSGLHGGIRKCDADCGNLMMKIKLLAAFLIWFFVFENTVFAQKEHNIWYFGDHAGLDFNSGIPVALTNGMLSTPEGCSSIADANGNLLFYTDGITVWDRNHNQMPNGFGLAGGESSTQSALIVPFPGNNMLFYIFTVQQYSTTKIFSYSVVDITLNNNNGDVTIKNSFITSPVTEKLTAVKHSNNYDIWIMVHGYNSNSFYAYLLTNAGLSAIPVVSNVGIIISSGNNAIGQMKFSPDGTHIALAIFSLSAYLFLFDFNATTGTVANQKYLYVPVYSPGYGVEFSTSGNYLYCTRYNPSYIYQWDISSDTSSVINSTIQQIGTSSAQYLGALQVAPDGKIYVAKYLHGSLGVINDPDSAGALCNYSDSAVFLAGKICTFGLPSFITSYFLPTGIITNNPQQNQLTIYPNPTTNEINISGLTFNVGNRISVLDQLGKTIFTKIFSAPAANCKLSTAGLSNGMYFLSVETEKDFVVKKVVVQH